ncbi:hypothetical protein T459_13487 [Capsicum annuum]|uniref:Uncharacterized protein n=1 Tax=Capsicum annuum TaxID=4072 RepID=A0A1U8GAX7_CAPAN|nr:uncharacterized protein LOC107866794 [Capsicum annuum]XP_016568270.1 uncharacterized protein LOC107866794 [Capsicum annuum]XP_016568271.1 uncharacterized protein LOC107866794 [Capsicum annuum]KAF3659572.1 putative catalase isozyme 3-like [Capsicum annuum]PHT85044.1 hypothetical protein T459_13487 [Capsicum annuum]
MINSEPIHSGVTTGGTGMPAFDKQHPGVTRKTALRDVQNQKSILMSNHQENSHFLGASPIADPTRVCGTKRLTPERPLNTSSSISLSSNGTNDNILNARRRFDLELGRGRIQNNMDKFVEATHSKNLVQLQRIIPQKQSQQREGSSGHPPVAMPNHSTPMMTFSHGGTSIPNSLGKATHNSHAAQIDSTKFSPQPMRTLDVKVDDGQQLTEHFIRLQKFLKQCDEANQADYLQMLLRLSPPELSKHAVDLEKRAIQLTIEEGKEMQRVKTLNVLGKSSPFANSSPTPVPLVPTKK